MALTVGCGDDPTAAETDGTSGGQDASTGLSSSGMPTSAMGEGSSGGTGGVDEGSTSEGTTVDEGGSSTVGGDASTTSGDAGSTSSSEADSTSTGAASVCGDGVISDDEVCDDGNLVESDGCSNDCQTAQCLVPVTHDTLNAAVDDLDCTRVWVMQGTYPETLEIDRDVDLIGVGNGDPVVVDGEGMQTTVQITGATVSLERITITGGRGQLGGGMAISGGAEVRLLDCIVTENVAHGSSAFGGGIWSQGALTLDGTTVSNNRVIVDTPDPNAQGRGGGISNYIPAGSLTITGGSVIDGNTVTTDGVDVAQLTGGGIESLENLTISSDTTITNNTVRCSATTTCIALGGGLIFAGEIPALSDFTVEGNRAIAEGPGDNRAEGGGIYAASVSDVSMQNVLIRGNEAEVAVGGGRAEGGGLHLDNSAVNATLDGVIIEENTARASATVASPPEVRAHGGGVFASSFVAGGPTLMFRDGAIVGNVATASGGSSPVAVGGGVWFFGEDPGSTDITALFERSEVSENSAEAFIAAGGGIFAGANGDGVVALRIYNSTISTNAATNEGGASYGGGVLTETLAGASTVSQVVRNTTFTQNTADQGGAFYMRRNVSTLGPSLSIRHAIIWGNTAATSGPVCAVSGTVSVAAQGYSIYDDVAGCPLVANATDSFADPMLGPLADNGGPTRTHAIDAASPATDGGNPAGCFDGIGGAFNLDQRSEPRPAPGTGCDIGAFEFQP